MNDLLLQALQPRNNGYLDTTFDEITLAGENFASYDYPVSLRFGPCLIQIFIASARQIVGFR